MYNPENIISIYDEEYASKYEAFYRHPWISKHELNIKNMKRILSELPQGNKKWLDICCGQAWHFSQFPGTIQKTGIDISEAQLRLATVKNPDAVFIPEDILGVTFQNDSFDIVTNFWASYCYLNNFNKIRTLMEKATKWTKKGGALYFEVLLPEDLRTFNNSPFAMQTGFYVTSRNCDFSEWTYQDIGGQHDMTSPPLEFFVDFLLENFGKVNAEHDSRFMVHLIATFKH